MRNKLLTFALAFIVLILWGLIIYKILGATIDNNDNMIVNSKPVIKEIYNDYELAKDTNRLILNYKDPFRLVIEKDSITSIKPKKIIIPVLAQPTRWDFITYAGYIRNPVSKKIIAVVNINGKDRDMMEGETIDNVKLIKNLRDSIKVTFKGKIKFIPLNHRI